MNKDLTEIVVVLDRSGSMNSCRSDAEGGLNRFIEDQKKVPGQALLTLVQFDHEYDFVHRAKPIKDVGHCALEPRGNTALLDAVGRAISETGERLKGLAENDRPALVLFAIITDGQENASREYTREKVREMIRHQTDVYKWQFTFLGANADAFAEASTIGISTSQAVMFANSANAYHGLSTKAASLRCAASLGQAVDLAYTVAEREQMEK